MFSSEKHPIDSHGITGTVALRSTEIMIFEMVKGKLKLGCRKFIDGNYILCERKRKK